ncbi:MAG: NYN domain-containing protein [Promethearchaeota archaeon]
MLFRCEKKFCGTNNNPFIYDLRKRIWKGQVPRFIVFEDQLKQADHSKSTLFGEKSALENKKATPHQKVKHEKHKDRVEVKINRKIGKNSNQKARKARTRRISLLTMDKMEFENYLHSHEEKIVILVDVPNFIRTLRNLYSNNFLEILRKAHDLLLNFIETYFHSKKGYVIHYYSKPDPDLAEANVLLEDTCCEKSNSEFFHLLEIEKSGHFSDIDNYLIVNAMAILERCTLKGFAIVSSDKDYLPVMKIASFKDFKSCILGINTSDIYEKHAIGDIKFLGIMKYLNSKKKA